MKKILSLTLIVAMISVLLTACSSGKPAAASSAQPAGSSQSAPKAKYPTKPIQIIAPTKAGGATDASARLIAQYLQAKLNSPVVVVNQDGGGGSVGAETVRTAAPDGYTLMYNHTMLPCNYYSGKYKYSYRDFIPIATMAYVSQTIAVSANAPWNTLDDLVQDAKKNPNKYVFGVQLGSVSQFLAGQLQVVSGAQFKMVDAGGEAEKLTALQGGNLHIIQATVGASNQYVQAKKMKVLAVATADRDPLGPDFKTAKEQGYDVAMPTMHTLYGPKGMPEDLVKTINGYFVEMEKDKDFMDKLNKAGQAFTYKDVAKTVEYVQKEDETIKTVAEKLGLKK